MKKRYLFKYLGTTAQGPDEWAIAIHKIQLSQPGYTFEHSFAVRRGDEIDLIVGCFSYKVKKL
jgi:hypothetical protein